MFLRWFYITSDVFVTPVNVPVVVADPETNLGVVPNEHWLGWKGLKNTYEPCDYSFFWDWNCRNWILFLQCLPYVLLRPPYFVMGNSYVFFGMKWLRRSWYFCSSERYCLLENVPTSCLDRTETGWEDEAGLMNVSNSDFAADCPLLSQTSSKLELWSFLGWISSSCSDFRLEPGQLDDLKDIIYWSNAKTIIVKIVRTDYGGRGFISFLFTWIETNDYAGYEWTIAYFFVSSIQWLWIFFHRYM